MVHKATKLEKEKKQQRRGRVETEKRAFDSFLIVAQHYMAFESNSHKMLLWLAWLRRLREEDSLHLHGFRIMEKRTRRNVSAIPFICLGFLMLNPDLSSDFPFNAS